VPRARDRKTGYPVMAGNGTGEASEIGFFDFATPANRPGIPVPSPSELTVAVVGLGYVGLPTALALWARGVRVVGLEISSSRISSIRSGAVDVVETDRSRLEAALRDPAFRITGDPKALADANAVIVCVPTPVDRHRDPELGPLRAAAATVVAHAVAGQLVILTSTSYVGCTRDLVATPLAARGFEVGRDVFVAYSPERIDPGNVTYPQEVVPRVLGGVTPACTARAEAVIGTVAPVHVVSSPEAAELTKLYENTFRAVNIALVNELEGISGVFNLDVSEVIDAASSKPFGFMPFRPGTGVGGHCIPCDPHYLLWQLRAHRHPSPVIEHAMAGISARPAEIVDRAVGMLSEAGRAIRGARVLVLGVAYKPGVEDVRESPALEMIEDLIDRGADVQYFDPLVPSVRLSSGHPLHSRKVAAVDGLDLVLVHVLQPGVDPSPFLNASLLLDPGDRLRRVIDQADGSTPTSMAVPLSRDHSAGAAPAMPEPESEARPDRRQPAGTVGR
jgi:UDP-N-acetyl-D-glucosamine dehydrogenase